MTYCSTATLTLRFRRLKSPLVYQAPSLEYFAPGLNVRTFFHCLYSIQLSLSSLATQSSVNLLSVEIHFPSIVLHLRTNLFPSFCSDFLLLFITMPLKKFENIQLPASADFHVHLRDNEVCEAVTKIIRQGGVNIVYVCVLSLEGTSQPSITDKSGHAKSGASNHDHRTCSLLSQLSSKNRTECQISHVFVSTPKYHTGHDSRSKKSGRYWGQVISRRCKSSAVSSFRK